MDLENLIQHARGEAPADLLIENARVVNVLSGEIQETSVALARSRIVGLGDYPAQDRLDLERRLSGARLHRRSRPHRE